MFGSEIKISHIQTWMDSRVTIIALLMQPWYILAIVFCIDAWDTISFWKISRLDSFNS